MSHEFTCPQCGELLTSSAELAPPSVCPHCGATISIPTAPLAPKMTPAAEMGKVSSDRRSALKRGIRRLCLVLLVVVLFFSILLPILVRVRSLSVRTVCSANLKCMGTAFYIYAEENDELLPIAHHLAADEQGAGNVDYTRAIGAYRGSEGDPEAGNTYLMDPPPDRLSTVRNLWVLIREEHAAPGSFICPTTDDMKNDEDNVRAYWDFGFGDIDRDVNVDEAKRAFSQVSYGYQVPYGQVGRPTIQRDSRLVIAADQGPFGHAIERGEAAPPPVTAKATSTPDVWETWNSPNHEDEGQLVLYADSHTTFEATPAAGLNNDNIYTRWSDTDDKTETRVQGAPPTLGGKQTPMDDNDTLIYP